MVLLSVVNLKASDADRKPLSPNTNGIHSISWVGNSKINDPSSPAPCHGHTRTNAPKTTPVRQLRTSVWYLTNSALIRCAINKIPIAPPPMNNSKTLRSNVLTATINAGYSPVNKSKKLPEIPGSNIADNAIAPANGQTHNAGSAVCGVCSPRAKAINTPKVREPNLCPHRGS